MKALIDLQITMFLLIQIFCVVLGKILYRRTEEKRRQCLSYGIICSNAGFLGNPYEPMLDMLDRKF